MISFVHTDDEWRQIIERAEYEKKALIVEFSAEWCGPCKRIFPQFQRHALEQESLAAPILFAKVDVDGAPQAASACGVSSMPTFQAYFDKTLLDQFSGADQRALSQFVERVATHVATIGEESTQTINEFSTCTHSPSNQDGLKNFAAAHNAAADNDSAIDESTNDAFSGRIVCVETDDEWLALVDYANNIDRPIIVQFVDGDVKRDSGDCATMYQLFGQYCRQHGPKALFAKVNIATAQQIAKLVGVSQVPAFLSIYNSRTIDAFASNDAAELEELINKTIKNI